MKTCLREVSMSEVTFDSASCQLHWQASDGALRTMNLLASEARQNAAEESTPKSALPPCNKPSNSCPGSPQFWF